MPAQNTSIIVAIVAGTIILLLLGGFIVTFVLIFQKRQQKILLEKQAIQSQFSQTLLESQLEIKEQTLRYIAHELHDNIGQLASLIKINLNTMLLADPSQIPQKVSATKELTQQLITDIKSISTSLASDKVVQLGLVKALENEVEKLNKSGALQASVTVTGPAPEIDGSKVVILFRMVQEIINNAVKHSGSPRFTIALQNSGSRLKLICSDEGTGFDIEEKSKGAGLGLHSLKSRAKMISASIDINSTPSSGTIISIELLT